MHTILYLYTYVHIKLYHTVNLCLLWEIVKLSSCFFKWNTSDIEECKLFIVSLTKNCCLLFALVRHRKEERVLFLCSFPRCAQWLKLGWYYAMIREFNPRWYYEQETKSISPMYGDRKPITQVITTASSIDISMKLMSGDRARHWIQALQSMIQLLKLNLNYRAEYSHLTVL